MTPIQVLDNLRVRGFSVRVEEGRLLVKPGKALTPIDAAVIQANREELVRLILPSLPSQEPVVERTEKLEEAPREDVLPDIEVTLHEMQAPLDQIYGIRSWEAEILYTAMEEAYLSGDARQLHLIHMRVVGRLAHLRRRCERNERFIVGEQTKKEESEEDVLEAQCRLWAQRGEMGKALMCANDIQDFDRGQRLIEWLLTSCDSTDNDKGERSDE